MSRGQISTIDAPGRTPVTLCRVDRTSSRVLFPGLLCLALLLSGCGSDSNGDDPPPSALECDVVAASASSAPPLSRIELDGLAGADEAEHWVRVDVGGFGSYPTPLYGAAPGEYELLVPLHPDGPAGGELALIVTDGFTSCPPIAFEVLALPTPSGDPATELAAALAGVAAALADRFDVDPQDLAATPLDELPPELLPLAVLFEGLGAVELETELDGLGAAELETLQGLLGMLDLAPVLDEFAAEISALPRNPPPVPGAAVTADPASALATMTPLEQALLPKRQLEEAMGAMAATAGECDALGAVDRSVFDLDTPDDLADYLRAARGAADTIGPLQDGLSDLNAGFTALGLVPGGGWATAGVSILWGWGSYLVDLAYQMRANLYPSAITRLTFELQESQIPEDWDVARDGEIEWSFAKLYAVNNGMNVARMIVDGALTTTSSAFAGAGAPAFVSAAETAGFAATDVAARSAIDARLDELQDAPDIVECWTIAPTEFGPVIVPDDSGAKWVTPDVISGEAITVVDRILTPVQTGASTLRVQTNTQELPGPRGFADRSVEVRKKSVRWLPTILRVEQTGQGEQVRLRFDDTQHADEGDVSFEPDEGIAGFTPIPAGGGLWDVYFTTPSDRADFPLQIVARSTSAQLPPDGSPREGLILITTDDDVRIAPRTGCVPFGEPLDLEATLASSTPGAVVEWDIVSGAGNLIVPGGTGELVSYVAPQSGSGSVTIRAALSVDSEVNDEVTLLHGNCVDIAVFYDLAAQLNLPGTTSGCASFEPGASFELENDPDGTGVDPEIPLAPGEKWGPTQSFTATESEISSGARGLGTPDECQGGVFPASYENFSTVRVTEAGDTVEFDVDLAASASCGMWTGDGGEACATAQSVSVYWTTWEFDVDEAGFYRVEVDLSCSSQPPQAFTLGNVVVGFLRFTEAGEAVLTHREFSKAQIVPLTGQCVDGGGPVVFDRTFEVDAPLASGTTDRLMIYMSAAVGAFANPQSQGSYDASATMDGDARVRNVGGP